MKFPSYFETYGGLNSVVKSRYFWAAVATTALCSKYYTQPGWWELAISIVPGLVGFSIAGVAIFVSLGSDSLRSVIAGKRVGSEEPSPFLTFMSMFTHFIVVQLLALFIALVSKALFDVAPISPNPFEAIAVSLKNPFWLLGGLTLSYAVILCAALALEIYRLARMIDTFQTVQNSRLKE